MASDTAAEHILILAPTGRDAPMIAQVLGRAGLSAEVVADVDDLCRRWRDGGAGAAFIAEEALGPAPLRRLTEALAGQPAWSDLPLVVMTGGGKATRATTAVAEALGPRGHVSLLERPVRMLTLVSAMQAALRARRRQYEVRGLLEEAREGVRQRDQFLAMLAHELRNPLAPIQNAVHILGLRPGDGVTAEQVRDMIGRQARHLARLVDDLLEVSRITQGKVVLRPERIDLGQLVRRAVADREAAFQAAGVAVAAEVPASPVWVDGDPTRLTQVVGNLLENARKFTDRGGRVSASVAADAKARQAVLRVRDTGIGIDPEMLPRLFGAFAQADRSLDRSRGGLGLGLAVAKNLVEMHGGVIRAASDGPGRGSEFTAWLPLARATAPAPTPPAARPAAKRLRILVVEDNPDAAESLKMLLELFGYEVSVAATGPAGVEAARRARPDVVLCDIGLPGMDGFAVADALRGCPETAGLRLIAITGYGQEEDRRRALAAGFNGHLVKPVDPDKLLGQLAGEPQEP